MSGAKKDNKSSAPSLLSCLLKPRPATKRPASPALPPPRTAKAPREGPGGLSKPSSDGQVAGPPRPQAAGAASSSRAPAGAELLPAHQFYGSRHAAGSSSGSAHAPTPPAPAAPAAAAAPAAEGAAADCPIHRFPLQQKAFAFIDAHPQGRHLRVFAQEASTDGKRSFLVTTPASFWRYYLQVRSRPPPQPALQARLCARAACWWPAPPARKRTPRPLRPASSAWALP
jgi:hypothetical protein